MRSQAADGDFNPRSREGSDSSLSMTFNTLEISIHAPVKGATQSEIDKLPEVKFQSTLPRVLRTRP